MNPAQLIAHFDRIGEAPDAIPCLRRFILDLAVRGKLVEQDPRDEPASELLKRIQTERERLLKEGKIKKYGALPAVQQEEVWPIPSCWAFVPLEILATPAGLFTDGDWVESKDQDPSGDVRLIQLADIGFGEFRNRSSRFMNKATASRLNCTILIPGDILIARMPDPLGRACLFPGDPKSSVTVVDVAVLRLGSPDFEASYVVHTINSPQFARNVESKAAGTTRSRISRGNLSLLPFPLPPLAEQHRIVAKVDELMALCDRLEMSHTERESRRDRLVASSLHRLNNGADPNAFQEHARFYFNHLPRLTTRPDHIKQLRQTILNLAVRGKLVHQDPTDEPASELLKRIEREKEQYIKEGTLRKEKPLAPVTEKAAPFLVPTSWSWARIGTCSLLTEYGTSVKSDNAEKGIPVLKMGDIQGGQVILGGQKKVPRQIEDLPQLFLKRFDLLYNRTNSAELVGKTGIYLGEDNAYTFASYLIRIRFINELMSPIYVNLAMNAQYFRETQIIPELKQQCGQANVNGTKLRNMLIPIPPNAEQHRIVAKADELMALCDQLETQLTTTQLESQKLMETILHEALALSKERVVSC